MILFAAIPIPAPIAKDIKRMQKGVPGARWRRAEQLHITLAYFGELTNETAEILDAEIARRELSPFKLQLKGGGFFGHRSPHMIWAGINEQAPLTHLHDYLKGCARRSGITLEKRKFIPHVTMAYLKNNTDSGRIAAFERNMAHFKSQPFWVDQILLYSSQPQKKGGNLYITEASYPLLGGQ